MTKGTKPNLLLARVAFVFSNVVMLSFVVTVLIIGAIFYIGLPEARFFFHVVGGVMVLLVLLVVIPNLQEWSKETLQSND